MTTPDLERRLTDLLQERAEGAMERTRPHEKLASLLDRGQHDLQRRRRRWAVGGGLAAAAAAVAIAVYLGRGDVDRAEPAPAVGPDAGAVASSFLEAAYAYDLDRAAGMFSADVEIVDKADTDEWLAEKAWNEAAGFSLDTQSCREGSTSSTGTEVHCTFALHALGSEQLGRGPYGDNTMDLTVVDGKIASVEEFWPYVSNGFSTEMWEPFAAWVVAKHPDDVLAMYDDNAQTGARVDARSLRLWEEHVAEYVDDPFLN